MRKSDSNFSKFIEKYIKSDTPRVLIECGANDGISGSVGLYYEMVHNWKVINIEANKYAFDKLATNRPNSLNLHMGLSDKEEVLKLIFPIDGPNGFAAGRGSFCRSKEEWRKEKKKKHHKKSKNNQQHREVLECMVKCNTLDCILNKYKIKEIGIFILDVEGLEEKVLLGMSKIQPSLLPKIMVIENDKSNMKKIKKLLSRLGPYSYVSDYKNNSIFLYNKGK